MSWDAIGAIGQAVSAFALIIVIVQVRHARAETRRSISQGRAAATRELALHHSDNAHLNIGSFKAFQALGGQSPPFATQLLDAGLTTEEMLAVLWHQWAYWSYRAQTVSQIDELPSGERIEFEKGVRRAYGDHTVDRLWYEEMKASLNPDAVRFIDNLLAQPA